MGGGGTKSKKTSEPKVVEETEESFDEIKDGFHVHRSTKKTIETVTETDKHDGEMIICFCCRVKQNVHESEDSTSSDEDEKDNKK